MIANALRNAVEEALQPAALEVAVYHARASTTYSPMGQGTVLARTN